MRFTAFFPSKLLAGAFQGSITYRTVSLNLPPGKLFCQKVRRGVLAFDQRAFSQFPANRLMVPIVYLQFSFSQTPAKTNCSVRRDFNPHTFRHLVFYRGVFRDPHGRDTPFTTHLLQSQLQGLLCCLSLVHSDSDITHLVSDHIVIGWVDYHQSRRLMSVVSSAILISQGETYTKYLGRICTGTSMLAAALSAVAASTGFGPATSSVTDWRELHFSTRLYVR